MKMSIRSRIFLPVLLLLVLLPLASYVVFDSTASNYMSGLAENDLHALMGIVDPVANRIFREPDDADTITPEQRAIVEDAQEKTFLKEIGPLLRRQTNEAKLLIFNDRFELIYPRSADEQTGAATLVAHFTAEFAASAQWMKNSEMQSLTLGDQEYRTSVKTIDNIVKTKVKYVIAYRPVYDTDRMLSDVARLVLIITASLAAASLLAMWAVAGTISEPIRRLCIHADRIGEGEFHEISERSALTEIDALSRAMGDMSRRLCHYDEAQKTFFQNASHELRTPLMSIRGYAEGIECGVFEDGKEAAGVIVSECARLTELVDGLLTLSRLDNNRQALELQPIYLSAFLGGYMKKLEGLAMARGISLSLENSALGLYVEADEELFARVIANVLSNCIRYAKKRVVVRICEEDPMAKITVEDDGDGFAPEDLKALFDRFYKGKGGNFGLGLSIAQSAAEYMGGGIRAFNGEDGAAFEISLKISTAPGKE